MTNLSYRKIEHQQLQDDKGERNNNDTTVLVYTWKKACQMYSIMLHTVYISVINNHFYITPLLPIVLYNLVHVHIMCITNL